MTLKTIVLELRQFIQVSQGNIWLLLKFMGAIWLVNIISWTFHLRLSRFGLIPRRAKGLIGIFTTTVLHQDFNHLFFNSIPLFVLGLCMMSFGMHIFYLASVIIILLESITVWFIGRPGNHIGASALITGYFSFIIISAYKQLTVTSIFAAAIVLYYFGSIFFSIFPTAEKTSWESHLLGFLAGIAAYFIVIF